VLPEVKISGPRPCRPEERRSGEHLLWICFGFGNPEDTPGSAGADQPDDALNVVGDRNWIVMVPSNGPMQGKVVSQIGVFRSQVLFGGSRLRIGSIGGVSTHPEFRQRGLARSILEYCARQLHGDGIPLMLISGERGLYTRTGNVGAMKFSYFCLQSGQVKRPEYLPAVSVRQFSKGDASILARLYQLEAVGFRRRNKNFDDDFSPGDLWIVEKDGSPEAYFVRMPWYSEPGNLEIVEYAGSRLALAAGLFQMLTGINDPPHSTNFQTLEIAVPWQDVDLAYLLELMGIKSTPQNLPGHTMRLINFPALLKDLGPYWTERLPRDLRLGLRFEQSGPLLVDPAVGEASDGRCALVWKHHRLELSTAQMTQLVFGSRDEAGEFEIRDLVMPEPLREIVRRIFPLPSFQPGLNLH
jgi:GNAT superfamily N-acetyltransferase